MPVLEAVQTFAGITNENEFYSHHYLAEVFKNDVKERLDAWDAAEAEHAGDDAHRAPPKRLHSWAQRWFALRGQVLRAHEPDERWHAFAQMQSGLLQALGYSSAPKELTTAEFVAGSPLPVVAARELHRGWQASVLDVVVDGLGTHAEHSGGVSLGDQAQIHKTHRRALSEVAMRRLGASFIRWALERRSHCVIGRSSGVKRPRWGLSAGG